MRTAFKILILEDNQSDVDLLQRELKRNGLYFVCEVVQTRESFENALDNYFPDIILSDFTLPAFDGISAFNIRQIKAPDTPFIIVSGSIGEERSVELIRDGVTDYALKDKLFSLCPKINRALADAAIRKEKKQTDTELKKQYEKLLKVAFLQSHQVRVPIANILGLYSLFNFENAEDPMNGKVLQMLKLVAEDLDKTIHEIVQNTSEIRDIIK
ncbi:response regulator [Mucilaginibacter xinganensis]|uniref:DNA-binding transcriptional regulator BaeR n=1 Tax=Mucilaginibacter xinganensis TaxID=1234841 RepID=A0A223NXS4_9SPHI|nr:response regulator [Mucilaginibacter xinganensis]ASU34662.1 DNA-binding transcriptional regulator BaeR [Mucilaginibacter xinganensis]